MLQPGELDGVFVPLYFALLLVDVRSIGQSHLVELIEGVAQLGFLKIGGLPQGCSGLAIKQAVDERPADFQPLIEHDQPVGELGDLHLGFEDILLRALSDPVLGLGDLFEAPEQFLVFLHDLDGLVDEEVIVVSLLEVRDHLAARLLIVPRLGLGFLGSHLALEAEFAGKRDLLLDGEGSARGRVIFLQSRGYQVPHVLKRENRIVQGLLRQDSGLFGFHRLFRRLDGRVLLQRRPHQIFQCHGCLLRGGLLFLRSVLPALVFLRRRSLHLSRLLRLGQTDPGQP